MKRKATVPLGNLLLTRVASALLVAERRGGGGYRVSYWIGLRFPTEADHAVRRRHADNRCGAAARARVRRTAAVERGGGAGDERRARGEEDAPLAAQLCAPAA